MSKIFLAAKFTGIMLFVVSPDFCGAQVSNEGQTRPTVSLIVKKVKVEYFGRARIPIYRASYERVTAYWDARYNAYCFSNGYHYYKLPGQYGAHAIQIDQRGDNYWYYSMSNDGLSPQPSYRPGRPSYYQSGGATYWRNGRFHGWVDSKGSHHLLGSS